MIQQMRRLQTMNYGFTLVEIMIALTLLSMILLLLFGSLHTVNRSWQSGLEKIDKNDEIRLVSDFIRRQITQTVPLLWINKDGDRLVFYGEQNELTFTSTLPSHRGGGGLYFMTLKVNETGKSKQLGLNYYRANPGISPFDPPPVDEQTHVLLLENIDIINFAYYGQDNSDDDPKWHDSWQNEQTLPKLVRLNIHQSEPERSWPVMTMAIPSKHTQGQPQYILQDRRESPLAYQ
jgi:general secretion pathway protein J